MHKITSHHAFWFVLGGVVTWFAMPYVQGFLGRRSG